MTKVVYVLLDLTSYKKILFETYHKLLLNFGLGNTPSDKEGLSISKVGFQIQHQQKLVQHDLHSKVDS